MRNPNRAVTRNPRLREVGARCRAVLDKLLTERPSILAAEKGLGAEDAKDFVWEDVLEARRRLAVEFEGLLLAVGSGACCSGA